MDQFVCIRDDWGHKPNLNCWPVIGGVYTLRNQVWIKAVAACPPMLFYRFEEIVNPIVITMEPVFDAEWFRPVRKTNIESLLALQQSREDVLT